MTSVVTPCAMELRARGSTRSVASEWLCMSMKPGATTKPLMSSDWVVSRPSRLPMQAIRPSAIPTSAVRGGPPVPSTSVPPRRATSSIRPRRLLTAQRGGGLLVQLASLGDNHAVFAPCVLRCELAVPNVARDLGRRPLQWVPPPASTGGQVAEEVALLHWLAELRRQRSRL